jgi:hypothetical protein
MVEGVIDASKEGVEGRKTYPVRVPGIVSISFTI